MWTDREGSEINQNCVQERRVHKSGVQQLCLSGLSWRSRRRSESVDNRLIIPPTNKTYKSLESKTNNIERGNWSIEIHFLYTRKCCEINLGFNLHHPHNNSKKRTCGVFSMGIVESNTVPEHRQAGAIHRAGSQGTAFFTTNSSSSASSDLIWGADKARLMIARVQINSTATFIVGELHGIKSLARYYGHNAISCLFPDHFIRLLNTT